MRLRSASTPCAYLHKPDAPEVSLSNKALKQLRKRFENSSNLLRLEAGLMRNSEFGMRN